MGMKYKQEPPFCIQVELTEGCNLYCDFCGLQGIRGKKFKSYKFLTIATAKKLAKQIADAGWNARIEFAMHGEPTMNLYMLDIISIFRQALPNNQLMMTSNGGGLLRDPQVMIESLFNCGLNVLALDSYESVKIVPKIEDKLYIVDEVPVEDGEKPVTYSMNSDKFKVYRYPEDKDASPHKRWPKGTKALIIVKDISVAVNGVHATLNNHCGAGAPLNNKAAGKRCAKPFREISVRWNGAVALCCNDWRGVYKCGNVTKDSIEAIWQGAQFSAARKFLYHGLRVFPPCQGCDALSYRVGFLPDKKGQVSLPKPTTKDKRMVSHATSGRPYTKAVKREWEK